MGMLKLEGVTHWSIPVNDRHFTGPRELYFLDPSGNMLELRDRTWKPGMPTPSYEEIVRS